MTTHLSAQEVAGYLRADLSPDELLRIDDHLGACADCRRRVGGWPGDSPSADPLVEALTAGGDLREHLSYEQLEAYVDGTADGRARATVDAHVERCASCADDLDDLRAAARAGVPRRPVGRWLGLAAAGVAAAGVTGWLALGRTAPPSGTDLSTSAGVTDATPPAAPAEAAATFTDGGRTVTLDAQGNLSGIPALDPADREAIVAALRTGTLPIPSDLAQLGSARGTLMSPQGAAGDFRPLRPVATAIDGARAVFEWTAVAGATYTISVFTDALEKVAEGTVPSATSWSPPRPLDPGRTYLWQVRARTSSREILTPQPPEPEARFRTLTEDEARRVEALRSRYADSPLARAVVFARAGLIDEARMSLEALAAANPRSEDVQRLLSSATGRPRSR